MATIKYQGIEYKFPKMTRLRALELRKLTGIVAARVKDDDAEELLAFQLWTAKREAGEDPGPFAEFDYAYDDLEVTDDEVEGETNPTST